MGFIWQPSKQWITTHWIFLRLLFRQPEKKRNIRKILIKSNITFCSWKEFFSLVNLVNFFRRFVTLLWCQNWHLISKKRRKKKLVIPSVCYHFQSISWRNFFSFLLSYLFRMLSKCGLFQCDSGENCNSICLPFWIKILF